ncbi:hypothetical protein ND748_33245, partial [Frankia sp. AiPs1]|nr:hypothetical protein [Frankia sp. AiPs1]
MGVHVGFGFVVAPIPGIGPPGIVDLPEGTDPPKGTISREGTDPPERTGSPEGADPPGGRDEPGVVGARSDATRTPPPGTGSGRAIANPVAKPGLLPAPIPAAADPDPDLATDADPGPDLATDGDADAPGTGPAADADA